MAELSMAAIEADILADLHDIGDRMLQYTYLVECGHELPALPEVQRCDDNLVRECQVRTWLVVEDTPQGRVLGGDSESFVVRGALALIKEMCDGRDPNEIAAHPWALLSDEAFAQHYTKMQLKGLRGAIARVAQEAGE